MGYDMTPLPTPGEQQFLALVKGLLIGGLIVSIFFGLIFYKNTKEVKALRERVHRVEEGVTYVTHVDPQTKAKTRYLLMGMAQVGEGKPQGYMPIFVNEAGYEEYYNNLRRAYIDYMEQKKNA